MLPGKYFLTCFLLFLPFVDCRDDGDTELINTSFGDKIESLHGEKPCKIKGATSVMNSEVERSFKLPTCLKEFYDMAHMNGCGKPEYMKFRYCAKALFFRGESYEKLDYKSLWEKEREVLILIDGCLSCPPWKDRATNLTIELITTKTKTVSDRFGDFKIGAIFKVDKSNQIQPKLKIKHTCNQYNMYQTKIVALPILYPNRLDKGVFEAIAAVIPLRQGPKLEEEVNLLPVSKKKKKE